MRKWYELGKKIGRIEYEVILSRLPDMLISHHDIEDEYLNILDYMKGMGLDVSNIINAKSEEYSALILDLIPARQRGMKRQLFLLGLYLRKLEIILINDIDGIFSESSFELLTYITESINALDLPKSLNKISLDTYIKKEFDAIDRAIINDARFDEKEYIENQPKREMDFYISIIVSIIVALIGAAGVIVAAIISKQ